MMRRVDWSAIAPGVSSGLLALGVVGLVGVATNAVEDERTAIILPLLVLALVGLGVAGWVAARRSHVGSPLVHAAAAAVGSVFIYGAIIAMGSDNFGWGAAAAWVLLAIAAGTAGGLAALRPRRRAESRG